MRHFSALAPLFIAAPLLIAGCRKKQDASQQIRTAAERYYGYLITGDVDAYLRSLHDYDALSDEYRSQLREIFAQCLQQEKEQHGGILSAQAIRDTLIDSIHAQAFVELVFGDSTREQVLLPLILTQEGWKLE